MTTNTNSTVDFDVMAANIRFLTDTVMKNIEAGPKLREEKEELKTRIEQIEKHIDSFVTYQNVINERVNHLTNISKERFRQMFDGFIRTNRDLEKIFEQNEKIHTQNKKILEWIEKQKTVEQPKEETAKYLPPIPPLIKNEETRPLLQPKPIDQFFSKEESIALTATTTTKTSVKIYKGESVQGYTTIKTHTIYPRGVDDPEDAYQWVISFKLSEVMRVNQRYKTNDKRPRTRFLRCILDIKEADALRHVTREFIQNPNNKSMKWVGLYLKLYDSKYKYKGERKIREKYLKLSRNEIIQIHDDVFDMMKKSKYCNSRTREEK